jgi:cytidylate kinase
LAPLIVVSGPPGAGKSTVARVVAGAFPKSALVRGDDFFAFLANGSVEPWLPEADRQNEVVLNAAAAAAGHLAAGGLTVVYDGVVGPWFLPGFASATGLAEISYIVLVPSEEQCLARVANRSGHGFTDAEAARQMYREFAAADLDDRHRLEEPPGADANAVAEAVLLRFRRGTLRFRPSASFAPGG